MHYEKYQWNRHRKAVSSKNAELSKLEHKEWPYMFYWFNWVRDQKHA